jgi:DNA replication protein DnaC
MTTTREQLRALLGELNLKGMARALDDELDRAERQAEPAVDVLHRLLTEQASFQRERRLVYRLAQARLPWPWTLDTFPFAKQPGVDRSQIRALAGLDLRSAVRRTWSSWARPERERPELPSACYARLA